eukprot:1073815_1
MATRSSKKPRLKAAKSTPQIKPSLSKKKSGPKKTKSKPLGKNKKSRSKIRISSPTQKKHSYQTGDYVQLTDLRLGYIRYIGQTAFCEDTLYGIELDDEFTGKHSGMFKGVKYFDCASPSKGLFVRLNRIASPVAPKKGKSNLGSNLSSTRSKHGRKLSAMTYRLNLNPNSSGSGRGGNVSRVSFVVPDMSALLSPTDSLLSDDEYSDYDGDNLDKPFNTLVRAYSAGMRESMVLDEETEAKYDDSDTAAKDANKLRLTPTGKVNISSSLENKMKRIYQKKKKKQNLMIGVRIPFGALNSKCMSVILSFLTMKELSEYAFVSQSAHDSIRLVPLYDFRYMLYDALCVQDIRSILCILKFHKPKELILPMAYFIYDPVVLRLLLQFFNVTNTNNEKHLFKYIHKLVIDDRDIRPSSWLMRPGNYPWNELGAAEDADDTAFPFELVECFGSLGNNLWELDIRYTVNVELSFFMRSVASVLYLSVSAENRMDMEQFYNVTHLTIQNKGSTWDEIERTELLSWRSSFKHLTHLVMINQRFEASCIDLYCLITWLPCIKSYLQSNCKFNEPTVSEAIGHMKDKSNLKNRLELFTMKRNNALSVTLLTVISQFFARLNTLLIVDCKLNKSSQFAFEFFKSMTHLTNIRITNLKQKKRIKEYGTWLHHIHSAITKYVYVCPVVIECTLIGSQQCIRSNVQCKDCKQMINKTHLTDHRRLMCPERSVECTLCGKVKRKSMTYHWRNNCKQYLIHCFLCPQYFTLKDTRHKTQDIRWIWIRNRANMKWFLCTIHRPRSLPISIRSIHCTITNCKQCQSNCKFNEPTVSEAIGHMKDKSNTNWFISMVMSGITVSLRFSGKLDGDLRKMGDNLVSLAQALLFAPNQGA